LYIYFLVIFDKQNNFSIFRNMRRFLLLIVLMISTGITYAQYKGYPKSDHFVEAGMHRGFKLGVGMATKNNYDLGLCAEYEVYWPVHHAFDIGMLLQYQKYSLFYQNISPYAPFTPGYAGASLRNSSDYVFFTPEINIPIPSERHPYEFNIYVTAGVGMLVNGSETFHKWDYSYNYPLYTISSYDTSYGTSSNINKMIFRYGFGLTQHTAIFNNNSYITFTEDFSFVAGDLSSTASPTYAGRTQYSPSTLRPVYFTFKVGYAIFRSK